MTLPPMAKLTADGATNTSVVCATDSAVPNGVAAVARARATAGDEPAAHHDGRDDLSVA